MTKIEWTDETWNPVTGCSKVSPGCAHCYAETVALRFWPTQYPQIPVLCEDEAGLSHTTRPREFTDVRWHDDRLDQPLHWKRPRRIFVNSMSDLFHEDVPQTFIAAVFNRMARARQHTFQILTKRAERMLDVVRLLGASIGGSSLYDPWPLPNVWLGVSVENQHFTNERIPLLLKTPAAVRFISAEPLLEKILLDDGCYSWLTCGSNMTAERYEALSPKEQADHCCCERFDEIGEHYRGIDWVIAGGESGPGARPCDLAWVRSIVAQCKSAGVPVFVKQLGRQPLAIGDSVNGAYLNLRNKKGGDPGEWPADLREREFPESPATTERATGGDRR